MWQENNSHTLNNMNITKSYIEGVKQRVELVRKSAEDKRIGYFEMHVWNLLDYLETIENFLEEEKIISGPQMTCEICHRPLYVRQDGSLTCVEMHH
jgi:hypothetical protein